MTKNWRKMRTFGYTVLKKYGVWLGQFRGTVCVIYCFITSRHLKQSSSDIWDAKSRHLGHAFISLGTIATWQNSSRIVSKVLTGVSCSRSVTILTEATCQISERSSDGNFSSLLFNEAIQISSLFLAFFELRYFLISKIGAKFAFNSSFNQAETQKKIA